MVAAGSIGPWPEGTVAIKEADKDPADGVIDEIAVMVKRAPGYDAANGDWLLRDGVIQWVNSLPATATG